MLFVAFVTVGIVAPEQSGVVVSIALYEGLLVLAWLVAAVGVGAWVLPLALRRSDDNGALRIVTAAALGLGAISLVTLLMGVVGVLNASTSWLIVGVGIALAVVRLKTTHASVRVSMLAPAGMAWFTLPLAIPLGVMLVGAGVMPGVLWGADDPAGYDVVAYHLQMPREWFEIGRIATLPHNVFSFFPLNVEMHYLLAMHLTGGAFKGMYLAQLMHGAFIALTVAAVYGATRDRVAKPIAALVCAAVPWMFMLGSVAYNEGGLMLYATLSAVWALRGKWALAGACAGLAAGCKLTGVTSAMLLVPMVIGPLSLWERVRVRALANAEGRRMNAESDSSFINQHSAFASGPHPGPLPEGEEVKALRGLAVFAVVSLLVFSPWLIRTAIASGGNPVFPLATSVFGTGPLDAGQAERFNVAHAPRPDQQSIHARLSALWTQVGGDYHFGSVGALPLWLALIVPAVFLSRRDRVAWACFALIVGNVGVWLVATHLQGRFLVQIVPLVALLAGTVTGRTKWAFAGLMVVVAVFSWQKPFTILRDRLVTVGVPDPSVLSVTLPPEVAHAIYETDRPLVLVGDAKAFWYAVPMSRITYRSVFDVRSDKSFKEAWLGDNVPADAIIVVDPNELARFEKTYRNLPAMPEAWRGRNEMFVVRPGEVP
jgi:hypothetical protein